MFLMRSKPSALAASLLLAGFLANAAPAEAQSWPCWGPGCGYGDGSGPYGDGSRSGWWPFGGGWGPMMGPMGGEPEMSYGPGRFMMARFGDIDSNHDGVVSDEEAAENVELTFYAMDADEDEALTMEEYMAVRMGHGPGYNSERRMRHEERKRERFEEMDQDGDGQVSKVEFMAAGQKRFEASDADGDGKVSPWEFRAKRRLG